MAWYIVGHSRTEFSNVMEYNGTKMERYTQEVFAMGHVMVRAIIMIQMEPSL